MFFQGALLVGYLYAHGLARFPLRVQGAVHTVLLIIVLGLAPVATSQWAPPQNASTVLWLLGSLVVYVGLPFSILASSAPLLQHWYSTSGTERAGDPYFLYAASNAGSLLALVLFPLFLERFFSLTTQLEAWNHVYVILALGILICFSIAHHKSDPAGQTSFAQKATWSGREIMKWLTLSFVPSSLMLGVTTHITTDIAAVSLFWVVPLALYLLTYIIAFSTYAGVATRYAVATLPVLIVVLLALVFRAEQITFLQMLLQLGIVTCISLILHFKLFASRPPRINLTFFYICIALGGFLGGLFNGLLAPLLFDGIVEFQLVLAFGVLIAEWEFVLKLWGRFRTAEWQGFKLDQAIAITVMTTAVAYWTIGFDDIQKALLFISMVLISTAAGSYAFGAWASGRIVALLCFQLYLGFSVFVNSHHGIYADRSFFGPFWVSEGETSGVKIRSFVHGTTVHGIQAADPQNAFGLQSYYTALGPVIDSFLATRRPASIGITGLGTGNTACIGQVGDQVTFFEIDPKIEFVARNYFTYLSGCEPTIDVVLGDARLSLKQVENGTFDVLILDAFTSDAVPIHLLTDEAAQIYESVLKSDGLMAFNISNRYLDLAPVLAGLASHRGWPAWILNSEKDPENPLSDPSTFVLIALSKDGAMVIDGIENAQRIEARQDFRIWTDDYSSILEILLW